MKKSFWSLFALNGFSFLFVRPMNELGKNNQHIWMYKIFTHGRHEEMWVVLTFFFWPPNKKTQTLMFFQLLRSEVWEV